MSLGLMNHTVIEQELNVQVQLTQVNVQRLLLESFTNRQVVNFLLNERLVLDKLPTDGLGNDVFTSQNIGKLVDDLDELFGLFYGVGDCLVVDFDVLRVGPCLIVVLTDELDDGLKDEVLQQSLI